MVGDNFQGRRQSGSNESPLFVDGQNLMATAAASVFKPDNTGPQKLHICGSGLTVRVLSIRPTVNRTYTPGLPLFPRGLPRVLAAAHRTEQKRVLPCFRQFGH